jgi:hypothetical protein
MCGVICPLTDTSSWRGTILNTQIYRRNRQKILCSDGGTKIVAVLSIRGSDPLNFSGKYMYQMLEQSVTLNFIFMGFVWGFDPM